MIITYPNFSENPSAEKMENKTQFISAFYINKFALQPI